MDGTHKGASCATTVTHAGLEQDKELDIDSDSDGDVELNTDAILEGSSLS